MSTTSFITIIADALPRLTVDELAQLHNAVATEVHQRAQRRHRDRARAWAAQQSARDREIGPIPPINPDAEQ